VLFLDEPTTGLDPRARLALWSVVRDLADGGTTVLLCTQYLDEADHLAHQIAVLDRGRIIAQGTPDELKGRVGGNRLRLRPAVPSESGRVAAAVAGLGEGEPQIDHDSGTVTLAVEADPAVVAEALRRLAAADVALADFALARPTLDDVFLSLTEHSVPDAEPAAGGRGR
jgi:ABC-2 type transport system ATP-binding protein